MPDCADPGSAGDARATITEYANRAIGPAREIRFLYDPAWREIDWQDRYITAFIKSTTCTGAHIIIPSIATFGSKLAHLVDFWQLLADKGVTLHGIEEQMVVPPSAHPAHPFMLALLRRMCVLEERVLTEWAERMAEQCKGDLHPLVRNGAHHVGGRVTKQIANILKLYNEGLSVPEISKRAHIQTNHLYNVLARLRRANILNRQ